MARRALREYLKRLEAQELEARDRRGDEDHPEVSSEVSDWEGVAAWPER